MNNRHNQPRYRFNEQLPLPPAGETKAEQRIRVWKQYGWELKGSTLEVAKKVASIIEAEDRRAEQIRMRG